MKDPGHVRLAIVSRDPDTYYIDYVLAPVDARFSTIAWIRRARPYAGPVAAFNVEELRMIAAELEAAEGLPRTPDELARELSAADSEYLELDEERRR